ncbi:hypothetical protein CMI42_04135, partial [Candidatus Pacearchaeota archaeon]|nr:hypothetical protein [Candidatus Pacearchaeota archaeon]
MELSNELRSQIEKHPEIDWSIVVKKAIEMKEKIKALESMEEIASKSRFTEEDANRMGEQAKQNRLK